MWEGTIRIWQHAIIGWWFEVETPMAQTVPMWRLTLKRAERDARVILEEEW